MTGAFLNSKLPAALVRSLPRKPTSVSTTWNALGTTASLLSLELGLSAYICPKHEQ